MSYEGGSTSGEGRRDYSDSLLKEILTRTGVDDVLEVLRKRHRRLILLSIQNVSVLKTDEVLFRGETDKDRIKIELIHNHLPKLEEYGYIEWDRETDEISKGPRFDEIAPLLKLMERHADELPPDWP